jgi:ATP-dependent Lhr-like helicase
MEARGEIRGGRFTAGFIGEQFALPEALDLLRAVRRNPGEEHLEVAAADPLNLAGIILPGARVSALSGETVLLAGGAGVFAELTKFVMPTQNHNVTEPRL